MKNLARIVVPLVIGILVGLVFSPRRGDSNPGHADSTLYFAVSSAKESASGKKLLEQLLTIDVRYVPLRIKSAFYRYVAAVTEEVEAKESGKDVLEFQKRSEAALKYFHAVAPE